MQANMIKNFKEKYPAKNRIDFKFAECRIAVSTNEKAIVDYLAEYFEPFVVNNIDDHKEVITINVCQAPVPELPISFTVKTPDPGKTKIKEEYADIDSFRIVRKRLTGMVFFFSEDEHLALGPCLDNLNQVVNFINNRFIQWKLCHGCLLGHSAAVILKDKGLSMAGFSGAGKSTLALHLMNYDGIFVSNDRLMIEKQNNGKSLLMHGVAKLPRINPGTALNNPNLIDVMNPEDRDRFSKLSTQDLWNLEHKYDVPIDRCFGANKFILSNTMHALVILNWKNGQGETIVKEVNPAERKDLLPAFMKSTGLFFLQSNECNMPEPVIENYIDHLALCKVIEISGGIDFKKASEACISQLEQI